MSTDTARYFYICNSICFISWQHFGTIFDPSMCCNPSKKKYLLLLGWEIQQSRWVKNIPELLQEDLAGLCEGLPQSKLRFIVGDKSKKLRQTNEETFGGQIKVPGSISIYIFTFSEVFICQ
jgi:hypothetical protein